ncbi:IscS subfamily cysteine desulfurase [Candidatus Erwinia haradaeae]|uniref:cysteine desulfurase n=1 Tax=Candidatus Erwinia haradaeae TaxID=1922217 RepID=A0A803FSW9_9GAMM|nr:Cysteine desulfurase IscS [Candidatus Erwinia haradaeae]
MKLPIYLDYSSTTPTDPIVVEKMLHYLTVDGIFGNPASRSHRYGWQAEEAVDISRQQIAELLCVDARAIIFTSGATESNNLAIKGAASYYQYKGRHIITSTTEHQSVLNTCKQLEREGFVITYLQPHYSGNITPQQLETAIRHDTILVSLMHVNNELGIIQDISSIGDICYKYGIIFHVDAAQSAGKVPITLNKLKIDLMSISAHKIYGPKGIGALFIRNKPPVHITTQIHGGGQERGIRSGTLPVHQIVGMGQAYHIANNTMSSDMKRIRTLRHRLWKGISHIRSISINGSLDHNAGHILNISFRNINPEILMINLQDLAVSTGSACHSSNIVPSHVLKEIGVSDEMARSSIRFSLGRFSTIEEIDYVINLINQVMQ